MSELKQAIDQHIRQLEERIRQLRIEWDLFFTGNRRIPPTKELDEADKLCKLLKNAAIPDNGQRFKAQSVCSNFIAMQELWTKRLRRQEEGRLPGRRPVPRATLTAAPAAPPPPDTVTLDNQNASGRLKGLFNKYLTLANPDEVKNLTFESFSSRIAQQVASIIRTQGCQAVQVSVRLEDGKVKLKAKPLKGE
jgi:hypothetical protein